MRLCGKMTAGGIPGDSSSEDDVYCRLGKRLKKCLFQAKNGSCTSRAFRYVYKYIEIYIVSQRSTLSHLILLILLTNVLLTPVFSNNLLEVDDSQISIFSIQLSPELQIHIASYLIFHACLLDTPLLISSKRNSSSR